MRFIVAALVLGAPLFAQCTYTLDKLNVNVPATGNANNTVTVTASAPSCRWLANVNSGAAFIHLATASQQIVTGSGTFTFSVDANPVGVARNGNIALVTDGAGAIVTVTQDAAVCSFAFSPTSQNFAVTGGNGAVSVTANCAWAVSTDAGDWVKLTPGSTGGTATATVPFSILGNGCRGARTANLFLNGSTLSKALVSSVTQDGSPANFSLSATSATADANASDGRFTVTTGNGCGWNATSDVSWMQITGGASGAGNGAISYHLIANTSAPRTGNIHVNVAPNTQILYTVTQQSAGPPSPSIASVNNAANYATDAVSPGQIVTLFGQNLGPSTLVPLQVTGGLLTTNLGGTQVLFDGVAAPMIYSLKTQVSAIAPYGLEGKTSTQVQVSFNGVASDAITVPVQPSTPAIFTLDSTGLGPGAILNQDFSINSLSLPAARGSVVAIYATGGGVTNPAVPDGSIVGSNLPRLTLPVSVTIGGVDAKVNYSGGVPSSIAGLTQINAEVPASVTPGAKIPITIKVGGVSSTPGVTIAVK
jgi:uncharacterized protein (TIGR03437 family)